MARQSKLTEKDMEVLRETDSAKNQHARPRSVIKDYSLSHRVTMEWDLNDEAKRDTMFRLTIDNESVILDWEEVMKSGRFI
jgi:hypothetical protein